MKMKKRWYFLLLIIVVPFVLIVINRKTEITKIKRPDYNGESISYPVIVERDGTESVVDVLVGPREILEDEIESAFEESFQNLYEKLKGKNKDFMHLESDLNFIKYTEPYGIQAEYFCDRYELIDPYGIINNKNITGPEECVLEVVFSYGNYAKKYEINAVVLPADVSDNERLQNSINNSVDLQDKSGEYVVLPGNVDGVKTRYFRKESGPVGIVFLALTAVAFICYYKKVYEPKRNKEKRNNEIMSDYTEIVSELSVLMGAGMSTYNALLKMTNDYKQSGVKREAYEELKLCISSIQSGKREIDAYRDFGKRCGALSYIKFCNLLVQNIKKGTENIFEILKKESQDAFIEKKAQIKKRGEEAGTKLLLPMILILMVVLMIIIIPAFMSF